MSADVLPTPARSGLKNLEVAFIRLMNSIVRMKESEKFEHWRFHAYVDKLRSIFDEMAESENKPSVDSTRRYKASLEELEAVKAKLVSGQPAMPDYLISIHQTTAASWKAAGCPLPRLDGLGNASGGGRGDWMTTTIEHRDTVDSYEMSSSLGSNSAQQLASSSPSKILIIDQPDVALRERLRRERLERRQLLQQTATPSSSSDQVDSTPKSSSSNDEQRQMIKREALADDMLELVGRLKHQHLAMSDQMKQDKMVLDSSIEQASRNQSTIGNVVNDLQRDLGSWGCAWAVWIGLLLALLVFFQLLAIMRLFRKRVDWWSPQSTAQGHHRSADWRSEL